MKKILLFAISILALACLFAFSASAAAPDASKECVTLNDGTVCPIWDTDGDALIWYKSTENVDDGYASYDYVKATSELVNYNCGWKGEAVDGAFQYQLGTITIADESGATYTASTIVVANLMDDVVISSGSNIGKPINSFAKTFTGAADLQYLYFPLGTVSINSETCKNCTQLQYSNLADLTELRVINSQAFNGCSNLFKGIALDLSNTKIIKILQGGLSSIAATSIKLPATLTTIGEWAFQNCKSATVIEFNSEITSLSANSLFKGCVALETISGIDSVFEKLVIKSFGNYMFESCKALKNIGGLMENGILIIPEGFTSTGSLSFNECDQIRYVEFPSTFNNVGQASFAWCDNLILANFDKVDAKNRELVANGGTATKFTFTNCGSFKGCPKLAVMCVPYGTTKIINRFVAQGCTTLTAFYMPETVTTLGTNGPSQGPFCNASNMYFVNEPFTVGQCLVDGEIDLSKLELPSKPSTYIMPENLTVIEGHVYSNQYSKDGTLFLNCKALNDVIVFGENFVDFNARNAFQGMGTSSSPKTVVFLGDMTQLVTFKNAQYISFVFANKADKSPEDLNILDIHYDQNNTNSFMYFCFDGSRYNYRISQNDMANYADIAAKVAAVMATKTNDALHVLDADAQISEDADCDSMGVVVNYCFCGAEISKVETPALGHDFEGGETIIVFGATLYDNVSQCIACARGCGANGEATDLGVVIEEKGYSTCDIGGIRSFTRGYFVNNELLNAYEAEKGVSVEIGFAFNLADGFDMDNYTLDSFKAVMPLKVSGEEFEARELDYMVRFKDDSYLDTLVVVAGYVSENGAVTFGGELESVSYNSLAKAGNVTVTPDENGGTVDGSIDIDSLLGLN